MLLLSVLAGFAGMSYRVLVKVGWVCVSAGTPGTWKAFGVIDA